MEVDVPAETQTDPLKPLEQKLESLTRNLGHVLDSKTDVVKEFNLTEKDIAEIHGTVVARVKQETDVGQATEGILSVEGLFEPTPIIDTVEKSTGKKIPIDRISPAQLKAQQLIQLALGVQPGDATYNPIDQRIGITPHGTHLSDLLAIARGNAAKIFGPQLAHEVTHAHQDIDRTMDNDVWLQKTREKLEDEPELSSVEAGSLVIRSEDAHILMEMQGHLVGSVLHYGHTEFMRHEKKRLVNDPASSDRIEELDARLSHGLRVADFNHSGFPSLEKYLTTVVMKCLPKSRQDNFYTNAKLLAAFRQLTLLEELGMNQRQIAELIRNHWQGLEDGTEWHTTDRMLSYQFLQDEINRRLDQQFSPLDKEQKEAELLKVAAEKRMKRALAVRMITLEELSSKIRAKKGW